MLRHAMFVSRASRSEASKKCSAGKNRLCQFLAAELESSAFDALESAPSSESTFETHIEREAARRAAGLRDGDGGSPDPQASFGSVSASSRLLQRRRAVLGYVPPRRRSSSAWVPQSFIEQGVPRPRRQVSLPPLPLTPRQTSLKRCRAATLGVEASLRC